MLHGDRAIARVVGVDRKGRPEGKIVEVTERANSKVVGRVYQEHGVWFVVAENRRISQDILLSPPEKKGPKPKSGQVVVVELVEQPSKQSQPIGRVVEVLGNYADPGMEIEIALRKHDLPFEFSKPALAETKKLPDDGTQERLEGPRGSDPTAAGDHRRRDGEGLRRCRLLRAPGQGLPAGRRHRRCLALRDGRRRARPARPMNAAIRCISRAG